MEHHLVEIGQELQRNEKEILGLRKKQLLYCDYGWANVDRS